MRPTTQLPRRLPRRVEIVEVGPRDGLQNEPRAISTAEKLELVRLALEAGVGAVQVTAFVHPRWVPQMADAEEVGRGLGELARRPGDEVARDRPAVRCSALVPNLKGYQRAVAAGVKAVDYVLSASDAFNRRNLNQSIAESLRELEQVARAAADDRVALRADISAAFHSPFEGAIAPARLAGVARQAASLGVGEVGLSDTDGFADPLAVGAGVEAVLAGTSLQVEQLALHLHDTCGRAIANVMAGLEVGVRRFDASAGGLGGCPYSPGASGNLATEDLVLLLHDLGIETGIDLDRMLDAAAYALQFSARPYQGHALRVKRPELFRQA